MNPGYGGMPFMPPTGFDSGFPSQNYAAFQSMSRPKPKLCMSNLCCQSQPDFQRQSILQHQLQQQQAQEQQLGTDTCLDMSAAADYQLVSSLMCLVEMLRAKRPACCPNPNTQPGQSGVPMGLIGLVPVELPVLEQPKDQKDTEPSTPSTASSPRLSTTSTLPRDSSAKTPPIARTPRRSTTSASSTRQPFEYKSQCRPSCPTAKNSNQAKEATQVSQNDMQTQTTFMSCPMSYPRQNLVWHRPCFSHSCRYP